MGRLCLLLIGVFCSKTGDNTFEPLIERILKARWVNNNLRPLEIITGSFHVRWWLLLYEPTLDLGDVTPCRPTRVVYARNCTRVARGYLCLFPTGNYTHVTRGKPHTWHAGIYAYYPRVYAWREPMLTTREDRRDGSLCLLPASTRVTRGYLNTPVAREYRYASIDARGYLDDTRGIVG